MNLFNTTILHEVTNLTPIKIITVLSLVNEVNLIDRFI